MEVGQPPRSAPTASNDGHNSGGFSAGSFAQAHLRRLLQDAEIPNISAWERCLTPILLRCSTEVIANVQAGDNMDIRRYIKVKRTPGGRLDESTYLAGVVFTHRLALDGMPQIITEPRVLLISCAIEVETQQRQFSFFKAGADQETQFLRQVVDKILELKPDVVLVEEGVDSAALNMLNAASVAVASNVKPSTLEMVARATGAHVISTTEELEQSCRIGSCERFEVKTYFNKDFPGRTKPYMFFSGCERSSGGVIVLRGDTNDVLTDVKTVAKFMVQAMYNVHLESCFLQDAFVDTSDIFDRGSGLTPTSAGHLPISPYVSFTEPSLLSRANQHVRLLSHWEQRSQEPSQKGESDIRAARQFTLINPESLQNDVEQVSQEARDVARAFYAEAYETTLRKCRDCEQMLQEQIYDQSDDPYSHRSFSTLFAVVCVETRIPCIDPELQTINFYDRQPEHTSCVSDCTLGQYLEDLWKSKEEICSAHGCGRSPMEHSRTYVHEASRVTVQIESISACSNDEISMWALCKECNNVTPAMPMSAETWRYSFGKYLELMLCSDSLPLKSPANCDHQSKEDHLRYFDLRDVRVCVRYENIDLLDIVAPQHYISWKVELDLKLKNDVFEEIEQRWEQFVTSITDRLGKIQFDVILPEKIEACKTAVQALSKRAEEEKEIMLRRLQTAYTETKYFETLPFTPVIRDMIQAAAQWDATFVKFEAEFLPDKDVRQLTALQLTSMFTDEGGQDYLPLSQSTVSSVDGDERPSHSNKSSQPTDVTIPSLRGSSLSDRAHDDRPSVDTSRSGLSVSEGREAENNKSAPPSILERPASDFNRSHSALSQGSSSRRNHSIKDVRSETVLPNEKGAAGESHKVQSRPHPPRSTSHPNRRSFRSMWKRTRDQQLEEASSENLRPVDLSTAERKLSDRFINALKSHKSSDISGLSFSERLGTKAGVFAELVEQLSREYETQRIENRNKRDEKLGKRKSTLKLPRSTTAAVVESFDDPGAAYKHSKAFQNDQEQSDESTLADRRNFDGFESHRTASSTVEQADAGRVSYPTTEGHALEDSVQTYSNKNSDRSGKSEKSLVESNPASQSTETSPEEPRLDGLPKAQKSTIFQSLTKFWSDRSPIGWKPLHYPVDATDHLFSDSDVIIRDDEPSSLIAFSLATSDYQEKLSLLRDSWSQRGSKGSDAVESDADTADAKENTTHLGDAQLERSLLKSTPNHFKYQFSEGKAKMDCRIFFAEQFEAIRHKTGIADRIVESLSRCLKWDSQGGKSRATFLKTLDNRFILKSLSAVESSAFLGFAPAYFDMVGKSLFHELPSAIAKIVGFFQVFIRNPSTDTDVRLDLLVMENLFYGRSPSRVFDLKGSMRNRRVESTGDKNEVLLDENMVEFIYDSPLFVGEHSARLLQTSIWNDTVFLSKQNVMDYSLMLAIDESKQELVVGIVDYVRTYTLDKKLESWIKDSGWMGGSKTRPTIMSPKEYKLRFREAMKRYVLQSPDGRHRPEITDRES